MTAVTASTAEQIETATVRINDSPLSRPPGRLFAHQEWNSISRVQLSRYLYLDTANPAKVPSAKINLGAPGLDFETWDPR